MADENQPQLKLYAIQKVFVNGCRAMDGEELSQHDGVVDSGGGNVSWVRSELTDTKQPDQTFLSQADSEYSEMCRS